MHTQILQGSVATVFDMRRQSLIQLHLAFIHESISERIIKIGQHFLKLSQKNKSGTFFFETQCIIIWNSTSDRPLTKWKLSHGKRYIVNELRAAIHTIERKQNSWEQQQSGKRWNNQ